MDVNRLSRGEQIAGVAAVLLLIDLFLKWYSFNVPNGSGLTAWQAFSMTDILLFLTCLAALAMVGTSATGRRAELPVSLPLVTAFLGALMTLIVFYRIINQPHDNRILNVEYGAYLGLILIAALTYGAVQAGGGVDTMRAEAESLGERPTAPAPPTPTPDPSPAPTPAPPTPTPDPSPAPTPDPVPPSPPQPD